MSTKRFLEILSVVVQVLFVIVAIGVTTATAQGLGGAGTVQGIVKDPTGGVMQAVEVKISNPVSGYSRTTTTDSAGKYVFSNLPPNPYHISVAAEGFQPFEKDVDVRSGVPITLDLSLALAGRNGDRGGGRPRGGSARARSDGAHRHRPEPDDEAAD